MIIQIRGASGSGKTTVVREVMKRVGKWKPFYIDGRKKPLGYRWKDRVVVGHYEIDCGGCDTIGSAPKVFEVIQGLEFGIAVSEGLLWSEDVRWTLQLDDVQAIFLATDPEECLRRVTTRQKGRKPADPARVRRKVMVKSRAIERVRLRLVDAGINCRRLSVRQATRKVEQWLRT